MTMQTFLDGVLSGALTTDATTWISPSFPNGYSRKGSIIVQNDASAQIVDQFGAQGGALTNQMTTTVYAVVTAWQIAGTSAPDGAEFQLKAVWWRNGATITAVKAPTIVDSNPNAHGSAWTCVLALNAGNGVKIVVTGDNAKTIRWSSIMTMYEG